MDDILMFNGHIVVKDMPAPQLFVYDYRKHPDNSCIRVELRCAESPSGIAELFLHKFNFVYKGGDSVEAKFDVLLLDNDYPLFYRTVANKFSESYTMIKKEVSVSDIAQLMINTKKYYEAHPIKKKKGLIAKIRGTEFDDILSVEHKGMLTSGKVSREELPGCYSMGKFYPGKKLKERY